MHFFSNPFFPVLIRFNSRRLDKGYLKDRNKYHCKHKGNHKVYCEGIGEELDEFCKLT